jgi:NADP-dependent 3-hydroxy acid dehydrogenase YdfG
VYQSVLELSSERLERLMATNVLAPIALARALIPRLCEGGVFIQLSSVTGRFLPGAKFTAYAATKAAMDVVVEGLRLELAPRRIRVCTVTPGLVDTPIYDKVDGFDAARRKITEQIPEWLHPWEVANAILFILEQPAHVAIPDLVITPTQQAR